MAGSPYPSEAPTTRSHRVRPRQPVPVRRPNAKGLAAKLAPKFQQAAALHQNHDLKAARAIYEDILRVMPKHALALHNLGLIDYQTGDLASALKRIEASLVLDPRHAGNHYNHGVVLQAAKRFEEAVESFDRVLSLQQQHIESMFSKGAALLECKRYEEALAVLNQAIILQPQRPDGLNNRGVALRNLEQPEEALASYDAALAIQPQHLDALRNRGRVLVQLERYEAALVSLEQALAIGPPHAESLFFKGLSLINLDRHEEGLACYEQVLAIDPNYSANVHTNLAMVNLALGRFEAGWQAYEWRWNQPPPTPYVKRQYPQPLWLGETPLAGKTLFVHCEQGFGDAIQFVRFLPQLYALGARVVLEATVSLHRLFADLGAQLILPGAPLPIFDCHIPLLSLPLALRMFSLADIPATVPYLRAEPERVAHWAHVLGPRTRPRIGLVWRGSYHVKWAKDKNIPATRNVPFALMARLNHPAFEFYSLQKEDDLDLPTRTQLWPTTNFHDPVEQLGDFMETAALVENLDLVIAVDTAVVHLAGALGKPVWMLNRKNGDWRWLLNRTDSPWYPSLRIFGQQQYHDWESVIDQVSEALQQSLAMGNFQ